MSENLVPARNLRYSFYCPYHCLTTEVVEIRYHSVCPITEKRGCLHCVCWDRTKGNVAYRSCSTPLWIRGKHLFMFHFYGIFENDKIRGVLCWFSKSVQNMNTPSIHCHCMPGMHLFVFKICNDTQTVGMLFGYSDTEVAW